MDCVECGETLRSGDEIVVELSGIYDDVIDIESMLSEGDLAFTGQVIHVKCKEGALTKGESKCTP